MPNAPTLPPKGSRWQHHSGRRYVVTGWSNLRSLAETDTQRAAKFPPRVHYALEGHEASDLEQYSRALAEWHESFVSA